MGPPAFDGLSAWSISQYIAVQCTIYHYQSTRSSSRYAALLLGPCGAGTLASRAGGLRPPWVAFGHIGAPYGRHRSHMHASPALVDLSSATIQRRAWLGKVAKNAGKRPAVAAMVDLSSPPIQRRASSDRVWSCPGFPNSWRKITSQPASPDRVWSCPDFPNSSRKIPLSRAGQDQTRSEFPKFVTENPPSAGHFPWRIWETLIVSDPVQAWSCLILIRVRQFVTKKKKEKDKTYFYGFR